MEGKLHISHASGHDMTAMTHDFVTRDAGNSQLPTFNFPTLPPPPRII